MVRWRRKLPAVVRQGISRARPHFISLNQHNINLLIATLKPQSNEPTYTNTAEGTERGRSIKCNSPPINGQ